MLTKFLYGLLLSLAAWTIYFYISQSKSAEPRPANWPKPLPELSFSPGHPHDFNAAKTILRKLYPNGRELYCNCPYELSARDRIDASSCAYRGHGIRSERIEWEHVVPASAFGRHFREWTLGHPACRRNHSPHKGRNCARQQSVLFRKMEADLYNLLPALGQLNAARSNYAYGEIKGERRSFGGCDFEVQSRRVEPRPDVRGDLARIYFYMDSRYPGFGIIHDKNISLLTTWNQDDPLDAPERARLLRIEQIQGNSFFIGRLQKPLSEGQTQPAGTAVSGAPG